MAAVQVGHFVYTYYVPAHTTTPAFTIDHVHSFVRHCSPVYVSQAVLSVHSPSARGECTWLEVHWATIVKQKHPQPASKSCAEGFAL